MTPEQYDKLTAQLNEIQAQLTPKQLPKIDLIKYAKTHIERLRNHQRIGTAISIQRSVNRFAKYINQSITLEELTPAILIQYKEHLRAQVTEDTANAYIIDLRTIYYAAMREFDININPFKNIKLKRIHNRRGFRALSLTELAKIWKYETSKNKRVQYALDTFKLIFILAGVNTCDIYDMPQYVNNTIAYNRQKTRDRRQDNAHTEINVNDTIREILNKLQDGKDRDKLINASKKYSNKREYNKQINRHLKTAARELNIKTRLTTYTARHTFATIARNKCNCDMADIAQALVHKNNSNIVDEYYIKEDYTRVDRVIAKVIQFIKSYLQTEDIERTGQESAWAQ